MANDAGYEAHHVIHIGLMGARDDELISRVRDEEFTFVTNNARDFLKLFAREPPHSGLVIIVPNVVPEVQRELFKAALAVARRSEPLNAAIRVSWDGRTVTVEVFVLPG